MTEKAEKLKKILDSVFFQPDFERGPYNDVYPLIYDHRFLRAFFGEHLYTLVPGDEIYSHTYGVETPQRIAAWKYHAKLMITSEDPISYLYAHM